MREFEVGTKVNALFCDSTEHVGLVVERDGHFVGLMVEGKLKFTVSSMCKPA